MISFAQHISHGMEIIAATQKTIQAKFPQVPNYCANLHKAYCLTFYLLLISVFLERKTVLWISRVCLTRS